MFTLHIKFHIMNWPVIIIVAVIIIAGIISLVVRNKKDEKVLEDQLNNDYPKPQTDEGDIEINEKLK